MFKYINNPTLKHNMDEEKLSTEIFEGKCWPGRFQLFKNELIISEWLFGNNLPPFAPTSI